jgi:hypothetical protein
VQVVDVREEAQEANHVDVGSAMRRAHLAAAMLLGWYLMVPPPAKDGGFDEGAPIAAWRDVAAFDTAKECAAAKAQRQHESKDGPDAAAASIIAKRGRCIASDDARLRGQ